MAFKRPKSKPRGSRKKKIGKRFFFALIESEDIEENAPRYDLNFTLWNAGIVYQFLSSTQ